MNKIYFRKCFIAIMIAMLVGQQPTVRATDGDPILDLGIFTWLKYQQKQFFTDITEIVIKDKAITSPDLTVEIYQPIIFENKDKTNHRLVFLTGIGNKMDLEYMSPVIQPGERWGLEIHTFGKFPYQCTLHPQERGSFTVNLK